MNINRIVALVAAVAMAACAAPRVARAVAVSDGFPDQSAHHVATGTSAAPLDAFDSFVASRAAAAAAVASFSSFVSTSVSSAGTLERFNSNAPAGFVIVVR